MSTFSEHLRIALDRAKDELGMSVPEVADLIGVSDAAMYKALKSGKGLGWEPLTRMCAALNLKGAARDDLLFHYLTSKAGRTAEGQAFIELVRELAKSGTTPRLRSRLVEIYEQAESDASARKKSPPAKG